MSRFVSAGTGPESPSAIDEWVQARAEVDSARHDKPVEKGRQEHGKSLYETLQANKAKKQEEFEEAAKLRNQFRALDDSEVEFLESIEESQRAKEAAHKRETETQLEIFRKQRLAAEQAALKEAQAQTAAQAQDIPPSGSWIASKKRRRTENVDISTPAAKLKKASSHDEDSIASTSPTELSVIVASSGKVEDTSSTDQIRKQPASSFKTSQSTAMGLVTYSSDDDDDD